MAGDDLGICHLYKLKKDWHCCYWKIKKEPKSGYHTTSEYNLGSSKNSKLKQEYNHECHKLVINKAINSAYGGLEEEDDEKSKEEGAPNLKWKKSKLKRPVSK